MSFWFHVCQTSMMFLQLDDIKNRLDEKIADLRDLLTTQYDETLLLLRHFKWSDENVKASDWFSNSAKINVEAGIDPKEIAELEKDEKNYTC